MDTRGRGTRWRTPRLILVAAVALAAGGVGAVIAPDPAAAAPLRVHASAIGLQIGTGVTQQLFSDAPYRTIAETEFNTITPRNALKWETLQPVRGRYHFGPADQMINFAQQRGQAVRGGPLVWHLQTPGWVQMLTGQELRAVMRDHITTVVSRYQGLVDHWDVVSEAISDNNGAFRDSFWHRALGPVYIEDALQFARAADPQARLYLSDYGIAGINAKSNAMYALAQDLLARGVPLDGIGFQGRFIAGQVPADLRQNLQRFVDLGLEVSITQMGVLMPVPHTPEVLQQQAADYAEVVRICTEMPGCAGVSVGDVIDPTSFIPPPFEYRSPYLFGQDYQPKPAYHAVHDVLSPPHLPGTPGELPPGGRPLPPPHRP